MQERAAKVQDCCMPLAFVLESDAKPFRSLRPELKSETGARSARGQFASFGLGRALKKHLFDAGVIEEIFDMTRAEDGATHMLMDRGRSMCGNGDAEGVRQRRSLEESSNSSTPRRIGLEHVHCAGLS